MAVMDQKVTDKYALYHGDCIEVLPTIPDNSVGLTVYSPPFAELYNYSSSDADLSNCRDYAEFLEHYVYVIKQIARITKPGRMSCIHCTDKFVRIGKFIDMPGDIIRLHEKLGFNYRGRHSVWKEPLMAALRSRSLHLQHGKAIVKDSVLAGVANPDYIVLMQKAGKNDEPIEHPRGLTRYAGSDQPPAEMVMKYANWDDPATNKLSHWIWQRYASAFWFDIRQGRLLDKKNAKEKDEEKHICPLQLDTIERCLDLYSAPGDVVMTPFLGIGSEAYCAVAMGRKAIGVELKQSYYNQAVRNVGEASEISLQDGPHDLFSYASLSCECDESESED